MINKNTVLAIIPARGGSKGILSKNIRQIAGKPLIAWTIGEAKKSRYIDRTILSSDDDEIMDVARQWNCEVPFIRPAELAQDHVTGIEPVLHALTAVGEKYDYFVLLQPTSPLRIVKDIDECIEKCVAQNAPVCVSVTEPDKSPFWMYSLDKEGRLRPVIKQKNMGMLRQQLKRIYALNGAVYVAKTEWFVKHKSFISEETIAYLMPKTRSADIDTEWDLKMCDMYMSNREKIIDIQE